MGLLDIINLIITFVILLVIVGIAVVLYNYYKDIPSNNTGYCSPCTPVGETGGPECPDGYEMYGGVCYLDRWTEFGGTKTAVCSVEYPGCSGAGYGCTVDITENLPAGTPCNNSNIAGWNSGDGYFVVNGYSTNYCAKGGTHDIWCDESTEGGDPTVCPDNADYFEGWCCTAKCPSGTRRTEFCICEGVD